MYKMKTFWHKTTFKPMQKPESYKNYSFFFLSCKFRFNTSVKMKIMPFGISVLLYKINFIATLYCLTWLSIANNKFLINYYTIKKCFATYAIYSTTKTKIWAQYNRPSGNASLICRLKYKQFNNQSKMRTLFTS